jgi:hypothetical protein
MREPARPPALLAALLAPALSCGLDVLGYEPGGADNLPTLGAGPYRKLPLDLETPVDEPFVLLDRGADLTDPEVHPRADGGFRLWFTRTSQEEEAIYYAELPALGQLPDLEPLRVLAADQDWEQGRVAAPSVVEDGDLLRLYYEGGVGIRAIGVATSTDGGATFTKDPQNPVLEAAGKPAATLAGDEVLLYAEELARGGGTILLAVSADGVDFGSPRVVLTPGPAGTFDADAVRDPFAVARRSDGRTHVGLFYVGESTRGGETLAALGFAGSFDGVTFERFAGGDAILEPFPPSERGPSAVLGPAGGLLFYSEPRSSRQQLAGARHP